MHVDISVAKINIIQKEGQIGRNGSRSNSSSPSKQGGDRELGEGT